MKYQNNRHKIRKICARFINMHKKMGFVVQITH